MIVFSALWVGIPLFIIGVVGAWLSILVPIGSEARQWWWFVGTLSGAALIGGAWIVSSTY